MLPKRILLSVTLGTGAILTHLNCSSNASPPLSAPSELDSGALGKGDAADTSTAATTEHDKTCSVREDGSCGAATDCCPPIMGTRVYLDAGGPCDGGEIPVSCSERSATGGCVLQPAGDCLVREGDGGSEVFTTLNFVSGLGSNWRRCTSEEKVMVLQAMDHCR